MLLRGGPFGFGLYRRLTALGLEVLVVHPQNWDERNRRVKTDKRDTGAMLGRLDRYLAGNTEALAVVQVPELGQEMARARSRQREQIRRHRQRPEAQGRTLMLEFGHRFRGRWWQPGRWEPIAKALPESLAGMVGSIRELILVLHRQVEALGQGLESQAPATGRIKGLGRLTEVIIGREIIDRNAFKNRRAVGSVTGLCPSEWSTGNSRRQGPISKCGRPRLRHALIEAAWRLVGFQPDYGPVKKWAPLMAAGTPPARKKAAVAIARQLAVDLWRIRTGRATAPALGLALC
ncbi:MAG TPA: transposase [Verrucomicrobiae bacterium]|nr:transposase [Verrucomicrobiae bacterium]